ncbi:hypothetical protein ACFPM0_18265 [Pseudonocardia sulfidoxydans]
MMGVTRNPGLHVAERRPFARPQQTGDPSPRISASCRLPVGEPPTG